MDMQKLFNLIDRTADNSSALAIPTSAELVTFIKESELATQVYAVKDVMDCIECIRDNQYSTVSEKRSMTAFVLRSIVQVICEKENLDLMYRFPNTSYSLHVGLVGRYTHTGYETLYGIRDCDPLGSGEPVWEYCKVDSPRLFDIIGSRMRRRNQVSIYGWNDPVNINKPIEYSDRFSIG